MHFAVRWINLLQINHQCEVCWLLIVLINLVMEIRLLSIKLCMNRTLQDKLFLNGISLKKFKLPNFVRHYY